VTRVSRVDLGGGMGIGLNLSKHEVSLNTQEKPVYDYDYICLAHGKIQYLKLEKLLTRKRGQFQILYSHKYEDREIIEPTRKRVFIKPLSNLSLVTAEKWGESEKQVVKIRHAKFVKNRPKDTESLSYVPKELPYVFPGWINSICQDILSDSNVLLTGDHGSGKSTVIMQLAARINLPCVRIQCSSDMTVESFLGGYVPSSSGGATWADGMVTKAARKGWWVILDEFDTCNASVRTVLNGVLEIPNRILSISDKDGGEILSTQNGTIHYNFRMFCTGNSFGSNSQNSDLYGGTLEQNAAQNSRFNIYHVPYLSEAELFKVVKNVLPNLRRKQISQIVKFATVVNMSKLPGVKFSTRTALAVGNKMAHGSSFVEALGPAMINHYEEAIGKKILKLVEGVKA
jgi:hypothetical protein